MGPKAFRVTYRRLVPMFPGLQPRCNEVIEVETLEQLVDLLMAPDNNEVELLEVEPLDGEF